MTTHPEIATIRSLLLLAAVLLLSACASTSSYHRGYGGGDYYYGAAGDSYYALESDRLCGLGAPYGYYGSYRCPRLGWEPISDYPYFARTGWPYPYHGGYAPGYGWNDGWSGSFWLGFGSSTWAYPGYYNPWFGPRWPYSVIYPVQGRSFRDRQRVHRERALQAAWQRHDRNRDAAGAGTAVRATSRRAGVVQRQSADARRRSQLPVPSRQPARAPRTLPAPSGPAGSGSMPRGRPNARGIPVDWPVNTRQPAPVIERTRKPQLRSQTVLPPRDSGGGLSVQRLREAPLPARAGPAPTSRPAEVVRSRPVLYQRPTPAIRHTAPRQSSTPSSRAPVSQSRPAAVATPQVIRRAPRGRPHHKP